MLGTAEATRQCKDKVSHIMLFFYAVSNTFKLSVKIKPNVFTAKMFQDY